MTDNSKAPERIYYNGSTQHARELRWKPPTSNIHPQHEYLRADLHTAALAEKDAEIARLTTARDRWASLEGASVNANIQLNADLLDAEQRCERLTVERDAALTGAVKVKPLTWKEDDWHWHRAWTKFGQWIIQKSKATAKPGWFFYHFPRQFHEEGVDIELHPTLEAAKAAAQSDYEARIRAAITADPDALQAVTAAAYEAAAEIIDTARDSVVAQALGQQLCCSGQMCGCQGADVGSFILHLIRALTPADALAAQSRRDAQMMAKGMREAADITAEWGYMMIPSDLRERADDIEKDA